MKRNFAFFSLLVFCAAIAVAQNKVSILGDSYSTFKGEVSPAWNFVWYDGERADNDVKQADQTWWRLVADEMGWEVEKNNSFSGATVCCTGYRKEDYSDRAFLTRVNDLGSPDYILVLGGTNDSWAKSPIGEYQYLDWKASDLYNFRPAFAYMINRLQTLYPNAVIVNIVNSELSDEITQSQAEICKHYGVKNVQLVDIDKQSGHPSVAGMRAIADQVKGVFGK